MQLSTRAPLPLACTLLALSALSPGQTTARAANVVRLTRFEEPAVLIPNHGPGVEYYRLIARARWEKGAFAPGKYNLRVVLPDGQAETESIPDQEASAG